VDRTDKRTEIMRLGGDGRTVSERFDRLLGDKRSLLGAWAMLAQVGAAVCTADAETDWRCP
jgi:hypothetical protein